MVKGQGGKKLLLSLFALGVMILILFAIGGFLLMDRPQSKVIEDQDSTQNSKILYEVRKKMSVGAIAKDLQAKHLISHPLAFRYFVKLTGQEKKIRSGFYFLPQNNSVLEMTYLLTTGKMATRSVTIPEGVTSWEIYSILKRYYPIDSLSFDSLVHAPDFTKSLGIEAPSLEGYLFPETYALPFEINERQILTHLVGGFTKATNAMNKESEVIRKYGVNGWVTLASIVEEEAAVSSEQSRIASVFYNRLVQGWSLGADPTVRFILKKPTGPLFVSDLNVNSPYNTRRFTGLPPGPICNPGRKALLAALNPPRTDNMFFVAKDNGSREHFFSATNSEHNRYKEKAMENREAKGAPVLISTPKKKPRMK